MELFKGESRDSSFGEGMWGLNTFRPTQNGCHFAGIFMNKNCCIMMQIS